MCWQRRQVSPDAPPEQQTLTSDTTNQRLQTEIGSKHSERPRVCSLAVVKTLKMLFEMKVSVSLLHKSKRKVCLFESADSSLFSVVINKTVFLTFVCWTVATVTIQEHRVCSKHGNSRKIRFRREYNKVTQSVEKIKPEAATFRNVEADQRL